MEEYICLREEYKRRKNKKTKTSSEGGFQKPNSQEAEINRQWNQKKIARQKNKNKNKNKQPEIRKKTNKQTNKQTNKKQIRQKNYHECNIMYIN